MCKKGRLNKTARASSRVQNNLANTGYENDDDDENDKNNYTFQIRKLMAKMQENIHKCKKKTQNKY